MAGEAASTADRVELGSFFIPTHTFYHHYHPTKGFLWLESAVFPLQFGVLGWFGGFKAAFGATLVGSPHLLPVVVRV